MHSFSFFFASLPPTTALSSCRLTPIKEEHQGGKARFSGNGDTLCQNLGATESGETLSHVFLVPSKPSPVEADEDEQEDRSTSSASRDLYGLIVVVFLSDVS